MFIFSFIQALFNELFKHTATEFLKTELNMPSKDILKGILAKTDVSLASMPVEVVPLPKLTSFAQLTTIPIERFEFKPSSLSAADQSRLMASLENLQTNPKAQSMLARIQRSQIDAFFVKLFVKFMKYEFEDALLKYFRELDKEEAQDRLADLLAAKGWENWLRESGQSFIEQAERFRQDALMRLNTETHDYLSKGWNDVEAHEKNIEEMRQSKHTIINTANVELNTMLDNLAPDWEVSREDRQSLIDEYLNMMYKKEKAERGMGKLFTGDADLEKLREEYKERIAYLTRRAELEGKRPFTASQSNDWLLKLLSEQIVNLEAHIKHKKDKHAEDSKSFNLNFSEFAAKNNKPISSKNIEKLDEEMTRKTASQVKKVADARVVRDEAKINKMNKVNDNLDVARNVIMLNGHQKNQSDPKIQGIHNQYQSLKDIRTSELQRQGLKFDNRDNKRNRI